MCNTEESLAVRLERSVHSYSEGCLGEDKGWSYQRGREGGSAGIH